MDRFCETMAIILVALWLLCGCGSSKTVPVQSAVHDTVRIVTVARDTLLCKDSVYVERYTKGDTVFQLRDRVRYRDRITVSRDTVYINRADTLRVPVPVERRLTWWERRVQDIKDLSLLVVVITAMVWIIRRIINNRNYGRRED